MSQKKFIITKDESTANKFIALGLQLISNVSGVWTFLNIMPKNFQFDGVDQKTFTYSNTLCL